MWWWDGEKVWIATSALRLLNTMVGLRSLFFLCLYEDELRRWNKLFFCFIIQRIVSKQPCVFRQKCFGALGVVSHSDPLSQFAKHFLNERAFLYLNRLKGPCIPLLLFLVPSVTISETEQHWPQKACAVRFSAVFWRTLIWCQFLMKSRE